jgi:predicted TIM-barrel fold metal-dependent hydrolase
VAVQGIGGLGHLGVQFASKLGFRTVAVSHGADKEALARELGAVAVVGNPNPINGRHVHDPAFEPLWDAIEELGVPVGFHPTGQSSLRDDLARRYLDTPNGRVIGVAGRNPVELMMAFGSLAAGGVLERHPHLRCAFLEGTCGWLPWYLWRLDETWEKFGPGSEVQISQLPSQYFFRQCFIATDADEKPLRHVIDAIGDDNIVVSTDYPHSDGLFPVAIEEFVHLEGVSEKSKAKILWDNCARLYPLAASAR